MTTATYEDSWNEFRRRTYPRYAAFTQLLKEKYGSVLEKATSMLDIGAGDGDFDVTLIKNLLLNLTDYHAVDTDKDLCKSLEKKIAAIEKRRLQVSVFAGFLEMYNGPPHKVDVIIMCSVAYYFPDKKGLIKQALDWIKPGGHLVMIHWQKDTPVYLSWADTNQQLGQDKESSANIDLGFEGSPLLTEMGIEHKEFVLPVPFDVTREGLDQVLRIVLHKSPTTEETDSFSSALDKYATWRDGVRYADMPYSILVIPKK